MPRVTKLRQELKCPDPEHNAPSYTFMLTLGGGGSGGGGGGAVGGGGVAPPPQTPISTFTPLPQTPPKRRKIHGVNLPGTNQDARDEEHLHERASPPLNGVMHGHPYFLRRTGEPDACYALQSTPGTQSHNQGLHSRTLTMGRGRPRN